eukprot:TRINITY_DN64206_c0_g1_i1.p1 TRINITY_DN64206_c0_g1~~TRINITY_DN64206_c0_g1_i1.p1  ORF type:complete len:637 (-),score=368.18 TRINITY_DN64206_c0_g1_i1:48-1766(-)
MEVRVGDDTETTFNDAFWEGLDGVCNALDNVKARRYVDERCVFYGKSLLESGTQGTKGNSQIVIPHKTCSYSDHRDPQDDAIPLCTLKNFPYKIDHCIEFARSEFEGLFTQAPQDVAVYLKDSDAYIADLQGPPEQQREALENVLAVLKLSASATFESCLEQAHRLFLRYFRDNILDITHTYPEKHTDPKTGSLYWSGPKRFPKAATVDVNDDNVINFYLSVTNLLARMYNIVDDATGKPVEKRDPEWFRAAVAKLQVPKYEPQRVRVTSPDDDENKDNGNDGGDDDDQEKKQRDEDAAKERDRLDAVIEQLSELRKSADAGSLNLNAAEFEKDDDTNFHIDFITAFANLRARNYRIPVASRHQCKMIAGKIIPAIATTTAMITGFVLVELYKLVLGKPVEAHRDANVNLAVNLFVLMEPGPPKCTKSVEFDLISGCPVRAVPEGFTPWDKTIVRCGDLTVNELVAELKRRVPGDGEISLSMLNHGQGALYTFQDSDDVLESKVKDLAFKMNGEPQVAGRHYLILVPILTDEETDADVILPTVVYYYREEDKIVEQEEQVDAAGGDHDAAAE